MKLIGGAVREAQARQRAASSEDRALFLKSTKYARSQTAPTRGIQMSAKLRLLCVVTGLLLGASAFAQEGHPAKGTWVGDWGPSPTQRYHLVVVMDYDGKNLSGVVNPGPNAIPITLARLDIIPGDPPPLISGGGAPVNPNAPPAKLPGFKVHIEAAAKDAKGGSITIVGDGTIQNLALPNRAIAGVWSQTSGGKTEKGEFNIRRQ